MICVLVSLKKEIDCFLDILHNVKKRKISGRAVYSGWIYGKDVKVIKTGIGSKPFDRKLLENCSRVISAGFCGALVPGLKTGDVVVSTELVLADEKFLNGLYRFAESAVRANRDNGLIEQEPKKNPWAVSVGEELRMLVGEKSVKIHHGRTVTASRTIRNYKEKFALGQTTGAVSVDMEDYYRLEHSCAAGKPFVSIRSVLDEISDDVPGFGSGFNFRSHVSSLLKNLTPAAVSLAQALNHLFTLKSLK
jgi:nucleoside phosphorylase